MSLATRLSAFFLIALAVVLFGFSAALYLLARNHLVHQVDERLQNALDTLEASVDIEPGGLEWEPADRRMTVGTDQGPSAVRWVVHDGQGAVVDHSANENTGGFPSAWQPTSWPPDLTDVTTFGAVTGWRVAARRLQLDELLRQGRGHPNDEPGYEKQYPTLVLVVGVQPAHVTATLSWLALTLAVLSSVVWLMAAVAGRWLCRRALAPVSRMAMAATEMSFADLGQRLPAAGTGDELDDLSRAFNDLLNRLSDAFAKLNAALDRQTRFAGDASHQLRTPLAALLGQVQVALRRDRSTDEYKRFLSRVQTEGTRLRQIIESLLLLARPDAARPSPAVIDLSEWLPNHLASWASHARAADLRVEVPGDDHLCVRAQPCLLAQLVDNLLENACKYSVPKSPVVLRAWREHETVALSVEDRGCGLEPDELSCVFEPFFRGEQPKLLGIAGVGLGLAVAQRIADAFGGTLDARNMPLEGCSFTLRLPEAYDAELDASKSERALSAHDVSPAAGHG
jgi:two-component system, OmpR family, sensor kinase